MPPFSSVLQLVLVLEPYNSLCGETPTSKWSSSCACYYKRQDFPANTHCRPTPLVPSPPPYHPPSYSRICLTILFSMEHTLDRVSNSHFPLLWEPPQGSQATISFGPEVVHSLNQELSVLPLTRRVRVSSVFPRDYPPKSPPPHFQDTASKTISRFSISSSKDPNPRGTGGHACVMVAMDIHLRC